MALRLLSQRPNVLDELADDPEPEETDHDPENDVTDRFDTVVEGLGN
jgi:hypothetical protein